MNNVFIGVISCSLGLLVEFKNYSAFHIRREHNSEVDRWEKYSSRLGEGESFINGEIKVLRIP